MKIKTLEILLNKEYSISVITITEAIKILLIPHLDVYPARGENLRNRCTLVKYETRSQERWLAAYSVAGSRKLEAEKHGMRVEKKKMTQLIGDRFHGVLGGIRRSGGERRGRDQKRVFNNCAIYRKRW